MSDPASFSSPAFFAWPPGGEDARTLVSVVTPMRNEAGGAESLIAEIAVALTGRDFEILAIDDGSDDDTRESLRRARGQTPQLRILVHEKNAGQSRALRTGVLAARGSVIATLDGDGQNDPADFPLLLDRLARDDALAMVAGERQGRKDSPAKRFSSSAANAIRRRILADGAVDTGCGLKVFYREAFLRLPYFDHMHRYLPALMAREGFKVGFEPVSHRPRVHGRSKYTNAGRLVVAMRDLVGVTWLRARSRDPGVISEARE